MDKYNLNLNPLIKYSQDKGGSSNAQAQMSSEIDKRRKIKEKYLLDDDIKKDFQLFKDTFISKQSKKHLVNLSEKSQKLAEKANLEIPTEYESIDSAIQKLDKIERMLISEKSKPLYKFLASETISNPNKQQAQPTLNSFIMKRNSNLSYNNPFATKETKENTAFKYKKVIDELIDGLKERFTK